MSYPQQPHYNYPPPPHLQQAEQSFASPPATQHLPLPPLQPHQPSQSHFADLTLDNTLEDLCARFIVNLPEEELESMDRVCFQIEQAHWYYEDFVRPTATNPSLLPSFGLKHFSLLMFRSCPLLHDLVPNHANIWTSFMAYKERVPVCGAILISQYWDKVLLVKGWQKGASWSFPRGKINKEETEGMCAVREVLEETGFDLLDQFPPDQLRFPYAEPEGATRSPYFVEIVIREQRIRLYFIPGVHEDTFFETRTRKEISKIDWFKLGDLPTWGKKDRKGRSKGGQTGEEKSAKFYMVTPFISHLKLWIDRNKPKGLKARAEEAGARDVPLVAGRAGEQVPLEGFGAHPTPHGMEPSDVDRTTSPSVEDSTEDEGIYDEGKPAPGFGTTEEGTQALQAFFFGGDPIAQPPPPAEQLTPDAQPAYLNGTPQARLPSFTRPAGIPSEDHFYSSIPATPDTLLPPPPLDSNSAPSSGMTPPQLQYERQSSFLQPKPKPTQVQTTRLLDMLNDKNPVASPPPPTAKPGKARRASDGVGQVGAEVQLPPPTVGMGQGQGVAGGNIGGGQQSGQSLLAILKGGGAQVPAREPAGELQGYMDRNAPQVLQQMSSQQQLQRDQQRPTTEEQLQAIQQHDLFQSRYNQPQPLHQQHQQYSVPPQQQQHQHQAFSAPPQQHQLPFPPPSSQQYPASSANGPLPPPQPQFAPVAQPFQGYSGQQAPHQLQQFPVRSLPPQQQQYGPGPGFAPAQQFPPPPVPGQPFHPAQHQQQHQPFPPPVQHFPGQSPLPQYAQPPPLPFHGQQPYPSPGPVPQQLGRPGQTQQQQNLLAAFGAPHVVPQQAQGLGQGQGQAGQLLGLFNAK